MAKIPTGDGSVRRQIVLPWSKSLEISYKSLKVRFFRSMITVSSLSLAVSFLAFVLVNLEVAQGFLDGGGADAAKYLLKSGFDVADGVVSMSAKERWIVFLSLLVCGVGIINAQLMSVTERFSEIGVMKCLGALDSMILRIFLLEAAMQGMVGAGVGAIAGTVISLLAGWIRFGGGALGSMSFPGMLGALGIAILAGTLLSLLGVLYPATMAARMRPIKALQSEH